MTEKIRDKFWLWGQDAGSHHKIWKLPGINRMDPAMGAGYFGIKNVCRVVMSGNPRPPFDSETEKLKNMNQIVWSAVGDTSSARNDSENDLDEVLRQAEKYPNVTGAVLDDFFRGEGYVPGNPVARQTVKQIRDMRDRLHNFRKRPLDLWLVWYQNQLDYEVQDYLDLCDVITFWTFNGADLPKLDETLQKVKRKTHGKRLLAGCYMWDYVRCTTLSIKEMKFQCEKYLDWMKKGEIEGIIFCSNTLMDIGLKAAAWTKNWIKEVGDEALKK